MRLDTIFSNGCVPKNRKPPIDSIDVPFSIYSQIVSWVTNLSG